MLNSGFIFTKIVVGARLRGDLDNRQVSTSSACCSASGKDEDLGPTLHLVVRSLKLEYGNRQRHMVVMEVLCVTQIRFSRLLVRFIGDDLASSVEKSGESPGRCFHGVVSLV
jgi:hypothetical protein